MIIKVNGVEITSPKEFTVTILDVDNSESTNRTADGTLNRDRVAVKRQIKMSWGALNWSTASALLQAISPVFFEVYYPDPQEGAYVTKNFYSSNRPAPVALSKGNDILWNNIRVTLVER
jgi:hypothetical protein